MGLGTISLQRVLQGEAYDIHPDTLEGEALGEFARWNVLAAVDELMEVLHEVRGWKPWSKREPEIEDRKSFLDELVDVQHFLNNLALIANISDEEFYEAYQEKAAINAQRQKDNYSR